MEKAHDRSPIMFPKLSLPKAIIRDNSKSAFKRGIQLNSYSAKSQIMQNITKHHSPINFLSSKVDFIDAKNQRRLSIHKKRILHFIKPHEFKKQEVFRSKSQRKNSMKLVHLVERVFFPQQKSFYDESQYIPLTNKLLYYDDTIN